MTRGSAPPSRAQGDRLGWGEGWRRGSFQGQPAPAFKRLALGCNRLVPPLSPGPFRRALEGAHFWWGRGGCQGRPAAPSASHRLALRGHPASPVLAPSPRRLAPRGQLASHALMPASHGLPLPYHRRAPALSRGAARLALRCHRPAPAPRPGASRWWHGRPRCQTRRLCARWLQDQPHCRRDP